MTGMEDTIIVTCPDCHKQMRMKNPAVPGMYKLSCPFCGKDFPVKIVGKKEEKKVAEKPVEKPAAEPEHRPTKPLVMKSGGHGCLVMKRGKLLSDRRYDLKEAVTTVGRSDSSLPSDISIDNDPTMSRRSVCITMEMRQEVPLYKLTVLNATNKVVCNGRGLDKGDSVYLSFGDVIVLGKTTFSFEKKQ